VDSSLARLPQGTPLDGTAPLFQYGYGSHGSSEDPELAATGRLMDVVVVGMAHVRAGERAGGGMRRAGNCRRRTPSLILSTSPHLTQKGYGAKDKIFAEGGSAGGL
jgi:oligopeptidase B